MRKESKIYIAGHRGLVGSAIYRRLESEGYSNLVARTSKELDLRRQADVEAFFEKEKPEHVFLAAAKVGGIMANSTYPADFIYSNLIIQANVIHAAYKSRVKKLLFLGSSCIYPKYAPQPMKEEYLLTGILEPTNEPYAISKIAGIKMCQAYNRQYGTNFISVMPTNLYGPKDNFDLETSHVLPALIRKFHEAKLLREQAKAEAKVKVKVKVKAETEAKVKVKGEDDKDFTQPKPQPQPFVLSEPQPVVIWGTGKPKREFLYVDDLADACIFLMESYDSSEIINIGAGEDISISDLAALIKEIAGYEGEVIYDSSRPDGAPQKLLDVSRLNSLGWKAKTGLRDGITKTYEWFVKNKGEL